MNALVWAQAPVSTDTTPAISVHGKLVEEGTTQSQLVAFDSLEVEIRERKYFPTNDVYFEVELTGKVLVDPKSLILLNQEKLVVTRETAFKQIFRVEKDKMLVEASQVTGEGTVLTQTYRLVVDDFEKIAETLNIKRKKKFHFTPQIGISSVSVTQPGSVVDATSAMLITARIALERKLGGSGWMVALTSFMNLVPISVSRTDGAFRFLGVNLRAGRSLPFLQDPWTLSIAVGYYYLTMLTNGSFGFSSVSGPQVYPTVQYAFKSGAVMSGYFKFSPISEGFSLLNLTSNEIATGIQYQFPKVADRKLNFGVGVDISSLALTANDTLGGTSTVRSSTLSLMGIVYF